MRYLDHGAPSLLKRAGRELVGEDNPLDVVVRVPVRECVVVPAHGVGREAAFTFGVVDLRGDAAVRIDGSAPGPPPLSNRQSSSRAGHSAT